ncbi:MAG: amidohydrolase family protein [Coriobacteriia bacterium]|nr:amidohydrolase family protein [Coriobacteriia bacterium]
MVDIHTHAFADDIAPRAIPALLESARGELTAHYDGTIDGLVAAMDRSGVDISVIQPVATKPGQVRAINDWAAAQASKRIVPFGAMHPELEDPAREIARMRALGLKGFKLHPEHQSFSPSEPRLRALFEATQDAGMIVLFHAGADVIHPTVNGTPEAFAALIDSFPRLTVVLAHLGGFREWEGVAEHLAGRDVWLDTSYTPGHLPDDEFVALVRAHGAHRVLFGSDGPWTDAGSEIAHLRSLPLTDAELESMLGTNARRLLML